MFLLKNNLFLTFLGAILLGIGFIIPNIWFISVFGFVIFLHLIKKIKGKKELLALSYLFGFIVWVFATLMIFLQTMPLNWYGIENIYFQIFVLIFTLILTSLAASFGFLIGAILIKKFSYNSYYDLILIPTIWVISEYIGGVIFYIASFGNGSHFGPHFSLGWLGYLLADDIVFYKRLLLVEPLL